MRKQSHKRCHVCHRLFNSIGYARHMAMHRDKARELKQPRTVIFYLGKIRGQRKSFAMNNGLKISIKKAELLVAGLKHTSVKETELESIITYIINTPTP